MSIARKIFYFFIAVSFTSIAHAGIPTLEHPVEIERVYSVPFEEVWNAVLRIAQSSNAIITEDKSSGVIVFVEHDKGTKSQIYMNVYIKKQPTANTTIVCVAPKYKKRRSFIKNTQVIFVAPGLDNCNAIDKEVERDFFKKLDQYLEKG